ncbi:DUF4625 domain-containing protein [Polaribacter sp. Z014]|uniref:DUF4625 domain-containing protein n=1 Tax=Polaribacter sp. Z014 TaxID=2927126 RepID=UPI002020F864|nr:DUF4625 domain-containing protein [Polaribacter sp. Z014]MCL7764115.1 DUF4625 domain-containing protein [Polaribacter sp. Z014]
MKTKMMKSSIKFLAIIAFVGITLQSCSSDDNIDLNAPIISGFEYGEGSEHTTDQVAYKGSDIHLEAEIMAEAVVSSITLSIHSHDLVAGDDEVEWEFEQVFTDTNYLVINPTFHEHVDVPTNIPAGEYHVELLVVDELGNSTEVDGYIQILDVITLSEISIDTTVARGDDFHAEFKIDAVNGIHSISVDAHAHGLTVGAGEVEWDFEQEFSGSYHEQTSVEFHEHIDVPATAPVGEYHIIFTVKDEDGNTKEYETHIDITA